MCGNITANLFNELNPNKNQLQIKNILLRFKQWGKEAKAAVIFCHVNNDPLLDKRKLARFQNMPYDHSNNFKDP